MQRENERIIYHLMHFDEKDKEWSERPYLLLEDMAIVFDILDLDDRSIQRIDHKKANKEQWSDQFLWESAKKNTKQLLPAKFEPVYKDFRGHTEDRPVFMVSNKIQRYGAAVICYEDFLDDISRKYNKSLYLLPTSIHEMLLLFDDGLPAYIWRWLPTRHSPLWKPLSGTISAATASTRSSAAATTARKSRLRQSWNRS